MMTFHPRRADPSLPHQVVITTKGYSFRLYVSCNCLRIGPAGTAGGIPPHEPIGEAPDYPTAARLYNDASNHRLPFHATDRIRIG